MANITSALTRLEESQRELVDVVFVTTDPARDDGAALRTYLDRYDPTFVGLTGDLATIVTMGKAVGVYVAKGEKLPTGGYEVDHGTPIVAIDSSDRSPIVWTEGISAADLAEDITTLLNKDLQ
jgi:protein SCO1